MIQHCRAILITFFWASLIQAQIDKVAPPNWWVGMQQDTLQIMFYGEGISEFTPSLVAKGVVLERTHKAENPNYLFLDLIISSDAQPGMITFKFSGGARQAFEYTYPLQGRSKPPEKYQGFGSSDAIYLITPDRFANGKPGNDRFTGLLEKGVDRSHDYKRHGGDIQGITNHLDYIEDMGFTAIWPQPLLINNMPEQSYHGYAITDFYMVDPRFGTLKEYRQLSTAAANRGIKLIMDQVVNHCGREHWWMKDLPFTDWVNYQQEYQAGKPLSITNHRRTVNQDSYASRYDRELMEKGWFVSAMPDLNQENPFMATYLIQNSIWWIETLQLGGIRQDTYPYPNKAFMARWAKAIQHEYPNFSIVGEEWSYNPLLVGYWQDGARNKDGYQSYLSSTMDFPMQRTLVTALLKEERWDTGLIQLYEGLANDFYYPHPKQLLLFGDNHDMDRLFTQLKEDVALTKMALAFILVAPRIPQVYYGTEILMENSEKPGDHGLIRTDFPGGWEGDPYNAFNGNGLTQEQREMQNYLKTLLNFRKFSKAIHEGQTVHFAPEQGLYVMFRHNDSEMVMLVLNKNTTEMELPLHRFKEMGLQGKLAKNIITNTTVACDTSLTINPKEALLLQIIK